jgi:hypothetical protein
VPLAQQALAIRGKALDPDHPDVAKSLSLASRLRIASPSKGSRKLGSRCFSPIMLPSETCDFHGRGLGKEEAL